MPNDTSREKSNDVLISKGDFEVSKRETGISITDTDNRSRSFDVDVNKDRSVTGGITWKH
ncbi:hypothetical protein AAIH69_13625 [Paenibacillus sp. MABNS29]|uniref:hypothetical protein n=1 Tax=Paenibacillus TaxID=44249 RepID=UPI00096F43E0|nr:hypothetical protein [Paenibacillus peoriae]OMF39740.1 hypothetical protein BK135_24875 [Paenibacillus peoriae]